MHHQKHTTTIQEYTERIQEYTERILEYTERIQEYPETLHLLGGVLLHALYSTVQLLSLEQHRRSRCGEITESILENTRIY